MSLKDAMRKAAGLLVELPPESGAASGEASEDSAVSDIDELLAKVDRTAEAVSRIETGPVPPPPPPIKGQKAETKTVEQIVRDAAGPNLDEIKAAPAKAPLVAPDGKVNLPAIYQHAGLPTTPFSAEQMLEMLSSLPAEVPLDTKRQMVKVTLGALGKSMGATPETIVADASRKLAALDAYIGHLTQQTDNFVSSAEADIEALQKQIEDKRRGIESARQKLTHLTQVCDNESQRLDDVLEFFSLDLPPSKYAGQAGDAEAKPQGKPQNTKDLKGA